MAQNVEIITSSSGYVILPSPTRQGSNLIGNWVGAAYKPGYTLLVDTALNNGVIEPIVQGNGVDDLVLNKQYNLPQSFGGQFTPVTGYLTTASDDSWEMRNKPTINYGQYGVTTQVPTLNLPLMTHIAAVAEPPLIMAEGIYRISYVIDRNNIIIEDNTGLGQATWDTAIYLCENMNPAVHVRLEAASGTSCIIFTPSGDFSIISGPFTINMGPGQKGIVEPFVVKVTLGTVKASMTF